MNKEFISYEEALELKELGYDEPCIAFYELDNKQVQVVGVEQRYNNPELLRMKDFCAPLYQQAFRWFREKGIVNSIRSHNDKCHEYYLIHNGKAFQSYHSSTYEQAELECLNHLIRLLNQNK